MDFIEDLSLLWMIGDDEPRPLLQPNELDTILKRARILDEDVAFDFLRYSSTWVTQPTAHDNGQISFVLRDMLGDKTEFSHFPGFYLHESGLELSVAEGETGIASVIDPADYTFDELGMTVTFDPARAETTPYVVLRGWLIDYNFAKLECCNRVLHRLALLPDVRNREFSELYGRVARMRDDLYGGVILHRGAQ